MLKSIRWKLISLYFILVFVAMTIVGVFITEQLQKYNLSNVRRTLSDASNNLVNESIDPTIDIVTQKHEIQRTLYNTTLPEGYEISIIDISSGIIVASTNTNLIDKQSMTVLSVEVLLETGDSNPVSKLIVEDGPYRSRYQHMVFTYDSGMNKNTGYMIYARASLESIDELLNHAKGIFLNATFIALVVTIFLGYVISISITTPINELKNKAIKMSEGDFSQRAVARSHDEIGQLASAFNFLTEKLNETLIEISSEQNKLNTIIEHMDDGLIAIDESGEIIHHNLASEKLLGIRVENKQSFNEIFLPLNNGISLQKIMDEAALNSSEKITNPFMITVNNKILKVSSAFFSDDDGILNGYAVLFQDITERERLDNMRKEFVANVSHELKTPITTIKSYSETLLSGALEEIELAKNFVEVIIKESDRMTALIRDLLQLSHIDFKKVTWNFESVDLNCLLADSVEKMRLYYEEKQQIVRLHLCEPPILIRADKNKLEQVITNIFSNAIKYTEPHGSIDISEKISDDHIDILICDTGLGIPQEDIEHIFERFYRVDKGRSREQGGTGLGLSIAKNIMEAHNGTIAVNSTLNKGTTFILTLPFNKSKM